MTYERNDNRNRNRMLIYAQYLCVQCVLISNVEIREGTADVETIVKLLKS